MPITRKINLDENGNVIGREDEKTEPSTSDSKDIFEGHAVLKNDSSGIMLQGQRAPYMVSNFGVHVKYVIQDGLNDDVSWILAIQRGEEPEKYIEMSNDDFCSASRLAKVLMKHRYVLKASDSDLRKIQEDLVGECDAAEKVNVLGFHADSGVYFFSNVAFNGKMIHPDEFGIIKYDGSHFFLPYLEGEGQRKNVFKNAKRFVYEDRKDINFNTWAKAFRITHLEESYIPTFFYIASVFRDIVFHANDNFPILYLRGPAGSGKSSIARSLTALFGKTQHEINLKAPNTTKSLPRLLGQMSNATLWLDEFHNGLNEDIKGMLQAVYDGGGYEKADKTQGIETLSVDIRSSLMLTSNFTPEDDIFFSRCILVSVDQSKKTGQQKEAFSEIKALEKGNLACITAELCQLRPLVLKRYKDYYNKFYKVLKKSGGGAYPERMVSNMASILAPAYALGNADKITLVDALPEGVTLFDWMVRRAERVMVKQHGISTHKSDVTIFWEFIQNMEDTGQIQRGRDYEFIEEKEELQLAIRIQKLYPMFAEQFYRVYRRTPVSKLDLIGQLKNHQTFRYNKNSIRFKNYGSGETQKASVTSALVFGYPTLNADFNLSLDDDKPVF